MIIIIDSRVESQYAPVHPNTSSHMRICVCACVCVCVCGCVCVCVCVCVCACLCVCCPAPAKVMRTSQFSVGTVFIQDLWDMMCRPACRSLFPNSLSERGTDRERGRE